MSATDQVGVTDGNVALKHMKEYFCDRLLRETNRRIAALKALGKTLDVAYVSFRRYEQGLASGTIPAIFNVWKGQEQPLEHAKKESDDPFFPRSLQLETTLVFKTRRFLRSNNASPL